MSIAITNFPNYGKLTTVETFNEAINKFFSVTLYKYNNLTLIVQFDIFLKQKILEQKTGFEKGAKLCVCFHWLPEINFDLSVKKNTVKLRKCTYFLSTTRYWHVWRNTIEG